MSETISGCHFAFRPGNEAGAGSEVVNIASGTQRYSFQTIGGARGLFKTADEIVSRLGIYFAEKGN